MVGILSIKYRINSSVQAKSRKSDLKSTKSVNKIIFTHSVAGLVELDQNW